MVPSANSAKVLATRKARAVCGPPRVGSRILRTACQLSGLLNPRAKRTVTTSQGGTARRESTRSPTAVPCKASVRHPTSSRSIRSCSTVSQIPSHTSRATRTTVLTRATVWLRTDRNRSISWREWLASEAAPLRESSSGTVTTCRTINCPSNSRTKASASGSKTPASDKLARGSSTRYRREAVALVISGNLPPIRYGAVLMVPRQGGPGDVPRPLPT